ncbi:mutator type transposase [Tanacetum coccineum]
MVVCEWHLRTYDEEVDEEHAYHSNLDFGLKALRIDQDVLNLINHTTKYKLIEIYCMHEYTDLEVVIEEKTPKKSKRDLVKKRTPMKSNRENDEDIDIAKDIYSDMEVSNESEDSEWIDEEHIVNASDSDTELEDRRKKPLRKLRKEHEKGGSVDNTTPFYVGKNFPDKETVRNLVYAHVVATRRQLYIWKNEKERIRVVCRGKCHVFNYPEDGLSVNGPSGSCLKNIGDNKIYRAKAKASMKVWGDYTKQYALLRDYVLNLQRTNPDTTMNLDVERCQLLTAVALGDDLDLTRDSNFSFMSDRQKVIDKSKGPLTPATVVLFKAITDEASFYKVLWNGDNQYQVMGPYNDKCVVDVKEKTCSYIKWELTSIPCKHVVAALWDRARNKSDVGIPESWVHACYWLVTWEKVYSYKINPLNGKDLWKKHHCPNTLIPPKFHPQIGRPPKKRKKSADELSTQKITSGGKLV